MTYYDYMRIYSRYYKTYSLLFLLNAVQSFGKRLSHALLSNVFVVIQMLLFDIIFMTVPTDTDILCKHTSC